MKFATANGEPLRPMEVTGDAGETIALVVDKDGRIEVPDDFQEVTSRLIAAGFVPYVQPKAKKE